MKSKRIKRPSISGAVKLLEKAAKKCEIKSGDNFLLPVAQVAISEKAKMLRFAANYLRNVGVP